MDYGFNEICEKLKLCINEMGEMQDGSALGVKNCD